MKYIVSLLLIFSTFIYAEDKIDRLIQQLGAESYKDRKEAEKSLWELLPESEDALRKAAESTDPEINIRAKRVLVKYEKGILPGITPEIKQKIDGFWTTPKKADYLKDWLYSSDFKDISHVVNIMKLSEKKGEPVFIKDMAKQRDLFSSLYLKYGDSAYYKYFIQKYAEQGDEDIYINWVKINKLTSREIAYYEALPEEEQLKYKSVMFRLYRIAGNKDKTEQLAKGIPELELSLNIQNRQYAEILQSDRFKSTSGSIGEDRVELLFKRMAGSKDEYRLKKQVLIDEYGTKVYKNNHLCALHTLIANGELKEAGEIAEKLEPLWYTRILSLTGDIEKIIDFGKQKADSRSAAFVAYELSKVYKKEECLKWLERSKLPELNDRWLYYYFKAYVFVHGISAAFDHVIDNADQLEVNSRYQIYYALCPVYSTLAGYIVGYRNEDVKDNFMLLKKFISKSLKGEDLAGFYNKIDSNNSQVSDVKTRFIYEAAIYLNDKEKLESSRKDFLKFDKNKLIEAQRLLLEGGFKESLELLDEIKVNDIELKLYLYIKLKCYEALADKDNYTRYLAEFQKSPTWDLGFSSDFIEFVYEMGDETLADSVMQQFGYESSLRNPGLLELSIDYAIKKGDLNLAEFFAVNYYQSRSRNTMYLYPAFALKLYLNLLKVEFEKAVKVKKPEEALKLAESFLEISPGDFEFHVAAVNSLKKNGFEKESDLFFAKYMKHYEDKLIVSPANSTAMNDWAWSAALCNRNLDEAEKKALKAISLDSENANIWDTLAEILFRKGEIEKALKTQTKACELVDGERYLTFRAKFLRFKGTLKK